MAHSVLNSPVQSRARPSLLRELNFQEVLSALQSRGPSSRAELARHTGISGPTVTRAVAALLEAGLLEEGDFRASGVGRPGKVLRLATEQATVVGVVVGPHQCDIVASGLDGLVDDEHVRLIATPLKYAELVAALVAEVRSLIAVRGKSALALGLSLPGLLDCRDGRTVLSPNVPQTNGRRLGHDLREALQLETTVWQESSALCLAEQVYGAARGVDDFALLDINEGFGLGVVQGGRILSGHRGLAGEMGHMTVELNGRRCGCGNHGCLETVATDAALASAVSRRLGVQLSIDEVMARIQNHELDVSAELEQLLAYLAVGLAAVINVFNPTRLFIYGRLLDAAPTAFERLLELTARRTLAPSLQDCQIIRARGNKRLGALAAAIRSVTSGGAALAGNSGHRRE